MLSDSHLSEIKSFFDQHGWVKVPEVLSAELIEDFQETVRVQLQLFLDKCNCDQSFTADRIAHDGAQWLKENGDGRSAEFYDTLWSTPAFINIGFSQRFISVIATLLETRRQNLYAPLVRCRIDHPEDESRTYGWHQEIFYTIPRSRYIQTWGPLVTDIPKQVGALRVLDKSFVGGIAPQTWNEIPVRTLQILVDEKTTDQYEEVHVETALGDMLFFDKCTIHASGTNTSDLTRYSFVGMYHDTSEPEYRCPQFPLWEFRGTSAREYFEQFAADNANK